MPPDEPVEQRPARVQVDGQGRVVGQGLDQWQVAIAIDALADLIEIADRLMLMQGEHEAESIVHSRNPFLAVRNALHANDWRPAYHRATGAFGWPRQLGCRDAAGALVTRSAILSHGVGNRQEQSLACGRGLYQIEAMKDLPIDSLFGWAEFIDGRRVWAVGLP